MPQLRTLAAFALAAVLLTWPSAALAQEYPSETGELDLAVELTITANLAGEGFVENSVVYITLISEDGEVEIDLGTLPTDANGVFSGLIELPDDLEPGAYTLRATGVTPEGATRVLSAPYLVGTEVTFSAPDTSTTSSSVIVPKTRSRGTGLDPLFDASTTPPDTGGGTDGRYAILPIITTFGVLAVAGALWLARRARL